MSINLKPEDLRQVLIRSYNDLKKSDWAGPGFNALVDEGSKAYLAAFDAMAEKAEKGEQFDKLEKLIGESGSSVAKVFDDFLVYSAGTRSTKTVIGRGPTLTEALKAVPE